MGLIGQNELERRVLTGGHAALEPKAAGGSPDSGTRVVPHRTWMPEPNRSSDRGRAFFHFVPVARRHGSANGATPQVFAMPSTFAFRILRTLGMFVLSLFVLLALTFVIGRHHATRSGRPHRWRTGGTPRLSRAMRAKLGLDLPILQQFWIYLQGILHGDFGNAVLTGTPVLPGHGASLPGDAGTGDPCHPAQRRHRRSRRSAGGPLS